MKKSENKQQNFVKSTLIISTILMAMIIAATVYLVLNWQQISIRRIERNIEAGSYYRAEGLLDEYQKQYADENIDEYIKICSYNIAKDAIETKNTEDARYRLRELGDYEQAKELLKECDYIDANILIENGEYEAAYEMLSKISEYKDAEDKILLCRYEMAKAALESDDLVDALEQFAALGAYEDAEQLADSTAIKVTGAGTVDEAYRILDGMNAGQMQKIAQLTAARESIKSNVIAVGHSHTVGLQYDGKVLAVGSNEYGQCDVESWGNIVAVDAGAYHTVGLGADGRVVAAGNNEYGQCDVEQWKNVVMIAAGAYNTYALLEDGTVVSAGYSDGDAFTELQNIKKIGAGSYAAFCIDEYGKVYVSHPSMYIGSEGAVAASVSTGYIAVVMPDGSVESGYSAIEGWEDIIAIDAGTNMVLGIKADGTIEAYFFRQRDMLELDEYVGVVAVAAGGAHSAIMLDDGSVITFGSNEYGQCSTQSWMLLKNNVDEGNP